MSAIANSGAFFDMAMRMILAGTALGSPEQMDAIHVCVRLAHAFRPGGMTPVDKFALREMREATARDGPLATAEKRGSYSRAVVAVETAARAVAATGDPLRRCEISQGLVLELMSWFDPRMLRAIAPTSAVVELLATYDPRASGKKGSRGSVKILAEIIVRAGGLDAPKTTVEQWARAISTAIGRTSTQLRE